MMESEKLGRAAKYGAIAGAGLVVTAVVGELVSSVATLALPAGSKGAAIAEKAEVAFRAAEWPGLVIGSVSALGLIRSERRKAARGAADSNT